WPRSVEWLRAHHGNCLVDEVEHYYYTWQAPAPGGPQLKTLPAVGVDTPPPRSTPARHRAAYVPPPIAPVFADPLPGEGIWRGTGPVVRGRPPVLVTTFRSEVAYPRIVAYVAWFDHTRTALAWYPGRYEPLNDGLATLLAYRDGRVDVRSWQGGPVAGPDIAFARQSLPLIVDHG